MEIKFGNRTIGMDHPTYFIADIAANHDGDLERARLLIRLAKEAGADVIVTACPYCLTMLTDGLKNQNRQDVQVLDIAEIIAMELKAGV